MKQINLLPPELASQRSRQRAVPALVLAVVAAIGTIMLPWWMLRGVEASLDEQISHQQEVLGISTGSEKAAESSFESAAVGEVGSKVAALNQLAAREVAWLSVLTTVGNLVPKDITLSTYTVTTNPTDVNIRLVGDAPSNLSFATFVESLRQNKLVSKVVVDGFSFSPTKGTVSFVVQVSSPIKNYRYSEVAK